MKKILSPWHRSRDEKKNKVIIYVILIIGMVLLTLPSFTVGEKKDIKKKNEFSISGRDRELKEILSEIEGVGKCEVMVTYRDSKEYIIAKDISVSEGGSEEKNVITGSGSGEKPFIVKEKLPAVLGVVVVCEGGGDIKIRNDVADAVCALCGIAKNKVKVFKK